MVSKIKVDEIESSQSGGNIALNSSMQLKSYTTTQINALTGMAAGDIVYDSDLGTIKIYNGTAWAGMSGSTFNVSVDFLVIAGGGGAGHDAGGGGGAGGYRNSYGTETSGGNSSSESTLILDGEFSIVGSILGE